MLESPYLLKAKFKSGGLVSKFSMENQAPEVVCGHHTDTDLIFSGADFLPPPCKSKRGIISLTRYLISASRDHQEDSSFLRNQSGNGKKNQVWEDHVVLILIPGNSWCLLIQVYKPLPPGCCWNHIHKLQRMAQGTHPSSPGLYNSWSRSLEEKRILQKETFSFWLNKCLPFVD